jgi:hypothetical protein
LRRERSPLSISPSKLSLPEMSPSQASPFTSLSPYPWIWKR